MLDVRALHELEQLISRPDYTANSAVQKRVANLQKKLWGKDSLKRKKPQKIRVTLNGKLVLEGTAEEIAARSVYSKNRIWAMAKNNAFDRYGKQYEYLKEKEDEGCGT